MKSGLKGARFERRRLGSQCHTLGEMLVACVRIEIVSTMRRGLSQETFQEVESKGPDGCFSMRGEGVQSDTDFWL